MLAHMRLSACSQGSSLISGGLKKLPFRVRFRRLCSWDSQIGHRVASEIERFARRLLLPVDIPNMAPLALLSLSFLLQKL